VLVGVLLGSVVGIFFVIRSNMRKSIVSVSDADTTLIRFYKDVSFLQKTALLKIFASIPENSKVIIDGSNTVYVDEDVVNLIKDFMVSSRSRGIAVELKKSSLALCSMFKES